MLNERCNTEKNGTNRPTTAINMAAIKKTTKTCPMIRRESTMAVNPLLAFIKYLWRKDPGLQAWDERALNPLERFPFRQCPDPMRTLLAYPA